MTVYGRNFLYLSWLILILLLLAACGPDELQMRASNMAQNGYTGLWENADPEASGAKELHIFIDSDGIAHIHSWGRCNLSFCDWGIVELELVDNTLKAHYSLLNGQIQKDLTLSLIESGQMEVFHRGDYDENMKFVLKPLPAATVTPTK